MCIRDRDRRAIIQFGADKSLRLFSLMTYSQITCFGGALNPRDLCPESCCLGRKEHACTKFQFSSSSLKGLTPKLSHYYNLRGGWWWERAGTPRVGPNQLLVGCFIK